LPFDVRKRCEVGDYNFNLSAQCKSLMEYWIGSDQDLLPGDNCHINPDTKEMDCHRTVSCEGGQPYKHDVNYMVYPCGKQCEGSLLIDCCNTCKMYAQNPSAIGVKEIMCEGCEASLLAAAADEANCDFDGHNFRCSEGGRCDIGRPHEEASTCVIYPCDECTDEVLKRSCCQECIEFMCEGNSLRRMVCKGCNSVLPLGSSEGGSFEWSIFFLLLIGCVAGVACIVFVRQSHKNNREATEEGEGDEDNE